MRVVTTLPAATESVAALGIEPVGVSHECDHPSGVAQLPAVTSSSIDASASSEEIDRQVLETDGDSGLYEVDGELLESLDPDLIVTQATCDVCAVDEAVVDRALEGTSIGPDVLTVDPHSVDDVLIDLKRLGEATNRDERAARVVSSLEARIESVRTRAEDRSLNADSNLRPRVTVLDWTNPVMVAGHWTAELVEWAGGEYGLAESGAPSRPREWGDIRAYDPEVLVVAPCGFGLEQTAANLDDLTTMDGWEELTAVQEGRAWAMDGHHYLNRPGPRLIDTLEHLAPIVSPARFDSPTEAVAIPFEALDALESSESAGRPSSRERTSSGV